MTLSPGTVLQQRYSIIRIIGSGGFGAVYEARDQRLGHRVALKQLRLAGTQVEQAFEREARILARLKHPALPKVSDHFMNANDYFLVMEYIEGDDFKALLEQRHAPFPLSQVLKWADQLLDGLEYLHSRQPPVIHRDIKPGNIKLEPEGKIYLLDFGIAKGGKINTYQAISEASIYAFSPYYASMEQIEAKGTDARSDLYSLGVTLHHLLTGVVPPQTVSRVNAKAMNRADPLRPVNELNPQVPASVARVLSQATEFDPNLRPKSARAMRDALKRAASRQTQAPPPPLPTSAIPTQIDNAPATFPDLATLPKWGIIVGVFLLLLVGAVGGRILFGGSSDTAAEGSKATEVAVISTEAPPTATEIPETETLPATEIATAEPPSAGTTLSLPVLEGTPVPEALSPISPANAAQVAPIARWGKGSISQVAYSPDGKWLAVGTSSAIYLYDAQSQEQIRIIEVNSPVRSVAISPDGTTLASGSTDDIVRLWRVSDGTLLNNLAGHTDDVISVSISPDGTMLASGSTDDTVRLWRVSDGSLINSLAGHRREVHSVALSPDGTTLASASEDGTVRLWRVSDGHLVNSLVGHTGSV